MCDVIETTCLLANVLKKHDEDVSFELLRNISRRIEVQFPDLVVDMSYFSVASAVENYPQMFCWHRDSVKRAEHSAPFFSEDFVNCQFNSRLPKTFRKRVMEFV